MRAKAFVCPSGGDVDVDARNIDEQQIDLFNATRPSEWIALIREV